MVNTSQQKVLGSIPEYGNPGPCFFSLFLQGYSGFLPVQSHAVSLTKDSEIVLCMFVVVPCNRLETCSGI